ncbi:MAG: hypothetical protein ACRDKW_01005 [Actinomycetota bacterium]
MPGQRTADAPVHAPGGLLSKPGFWASIAVSLLLGIATGLVLTVLAPDLPVVAGFAIQAVVMVLSLPLGPWLRSGRRAPG